ncbi:heme ABC transporter ATP-binding protein [Photobacterium aquae]|uniref:Heme ABC transporter ATP-binding protein n=1 Tax=Photobacterium aquae TaxID=1195763 RepID=A0A0J1GYW7_9GAMM|nr:ABC transporter ATP-binding protein [Photobacterium aquae]KLV04831.1 heme ABC transporter ATP-binding protein [Photobacterium aquae]
MSIQFSNFSFKYWALEQPTLKNINLTIEKGEKVVIIGPSGSGKSTLGQCLNGLIPFAVKGDISGSLTINGSETQHMDLHKCTNMVGTVLQDTDGQFVGLSIGEDIAFALENQMIAPGPMHEIVRETAAMLELDDMLELSPFELSGGQKQRVSLAGVMVDDVEILLFDEPLASLDPHTGRATIEIIDRLHRETEKTVVIIEHRLEDVLHCHVDRVILMDRGEIIANMTPDEILASPLLAKHGIREPLYLSAMKAAGCIITADDKPAHLASMDIERFKPQLLSWFEQQVPNNPTVNLKSLLGVSQLGYSYDGHRATLDDITFTVQEGEFVSILGKNGSGKSTITRLIMGVLEPDTGSIHFNGVDLAERSIFERSQDIGIVLQNPNHMISHHMIFDEVASGLRNRGVSETEIKEKVMATLELCGLGRYHHWPVDALSYGQKKRVTIASILVLEPKLLILDEPTAGQDYRHYTAMMSFIRELNQKLGITILIISHDMHLVLEYTERAIVIADSKLLVDEPVNRIFSQPDLLAQANLTETSLYTLGKVLGIERIDNFIHCFINHEANAQ